MAGSGAGAAIEGVVFADMNGGLPVLPICKLKHSSNQVAGHQFEEGNVGSLVDDSGFFYKPLQDGERGERETKFYEKFWADERVPSNIKEFFPQYRGCVLVDSNGTGLIKHAVLEDVTRNFRHPSIIDIKMGFQTWYPEASEKYIEKCKKKDEESTTKSLGIRISGMQVYQSAKWKADRNWCRNLSIRGVDNAIRRFVSTNPSDEENPDAALASHVYGRAIPQLEKIVSWFEEQTYYHFFSSSVLIIYEGDASEATGSEFDGEVSVKLVDFAHVTYDHHTIDESYLKALKSLITILSSLLTSLESR